MVFYSFACSDSQLSDKYTHVCQGLHLRMQILKIEMIMKNTLKIKNRGNFHVVTRGKYFRTVSSTIESA